MPTNTPPEQASFYRDLAARCGANQIACLKADSCSMAPLKQRLDTWRQAGNDGALPYLDSWSAILTEPFAARPWARSLLVLSFSPQPNPTSRILRPALKPRSATTHSCLSLRARSSVLVKSPS